MNTIFVRHCSDDFSALQMAQAIEAMGGTLVSVTYYAPYDQFVVFGRAPEGKLDEIDRFYETCMNTEKGGGS